VAASRSREPVFFPLFEMKARKEKRIMKKERGQDKLRKRNGKRSEKIDKNMTVSM
jgi:hypothetical protein